MCGIIGIVSNGKNVVGSVVSGLDGMLHRGYDSMGGLFVGNNGSRVFKISKEEKDPFSAADFERLIPSDLVATTGLGHTRWATFGRISKVNAHPHCETTEKIWVVQNGNVDNASDIIEELGDPPRYSETDTELIANLVANYFRESGDMVSAMFAAINRIEGPNAIVVCSLDRPDRLFATTKGSSLGLCKNGNGTIVCSDGQALGNGKQRIAWLKSGEVAVIGPDGWEISRRDVPEQDDDGFADDHGLHGFPYFMEKEIFEQARTIDRTMRGRLLPENGFVRLGGLGDITAELRKVRTFHFIGCGTAYHAGAFATLLMNRFGIAARSWIASEFVYSHPVFDPEDAFVFLSQSGETADTIEVLDEIRIKGNACLGIVNVPDSRIWRDTGVGIGIRAGRERGVAATKSFTSQLIALTMLALFAARQRKMTIDTAQRIIAELQQLPGKVALILDRANEVRQLAERYAQYRNGYFLGRYFNFISAMEGALKLKEISYIHAEAYQLGEMKHGPLALIDRNFPSIVIAPDDPVFKKSCVNMQEIKGRFGPILALTDERTDIAIADDVFRIPSTLDYLTPILMAVPLQLFAYYTALIKKKNPDKPRNLAKSVTVN